MEIWLHFFFFVKVKIALFFSEHIKYKLDLKVTGPLLERIVLQGPQLLNQQWSHLRRVRAPRH